MRILHGSRKLEAGGASSGGSTAVAVGIFDGVHVGHRVLFERANALGKRDGIESLAYTFDPHPAAVLAPELAPKLIEPIDTRLERIAACDLGATLVEVFDRDFSTISAESFVRDILVGKLGAKHIIVGKGFTFGHKQQGDIGMLERLGGDLGFETHAIDPVRVDGIHASSTKIREFVATGKMKGAQLLLGRPFELQGSVVRGEGRGGTIGIPTANLQPQNELLPAGGVYAGWVSGTFDRMPAVINIGFAPTFGPSALRVEAHILDYEGGELYGAVISIGFFDRIRSEKRFDGVDQLIAQINSDIAQARQMFESQS